MSAYLGRPVSSGKPRTVVPGEDGRVRADGHVLSPEAYENRRAYERARKLAQREMGRRYPKEYREFFERRRAEGRGRKDAEGYAERAVCQVHRDEYLAVLQRRKSEQVDPAVRASAVAALGRGDLDVLAAAEALGTTSTLVRKWVREDLPGGVEAHERALRARQIEEASLAEEAVAVRDLIEFGRRCRVCWGPRARSRDLTCSPRCAEAWAVVRYQVDAGERQRRRELVARYHVEHYPLKARGAARFLAGLAKERGRWVLPGSRVESVLADVLRWRAENEASFGAPKDRGLPPPGRPTYAVHGEPGARKRRVRAKETT